MDDDRWIVWWRHEESPSARVFCFGHPGAGAAPFRTWADCIPQGIELCAIRAPGRESRYTEAPIDDMETFVCQVTPAIERHADLPVILFGHCSGALVAFEVGRSLARRRGGCPAHLVVASQPGPRARRQTPEDVRTLDLRERLRHANATDPAILRNDELLELLRPALVADFRLIDEYRYAAGESLTTPVSAVATARIASTHMSEIRSWATETSARFEFVVLETESFFSPEGWRDLALAVGSSITALAPA